MYLHKHTQSDFFTLSNTFLTADFDKLQSLYTLSLKSRQTKLFLLTRMGYQIT